MNRRTYALAPALLGSTFFAIGYGPSGVVEIMRREQEGWSYLRP